MSQLQIDNDTMPEEYTVDLTFVPPMWWEKANERIEAGDVEGLLVLADSKYGMSIVFQNMFPLLSRGIYEKGLISAFVNTPVNNINFSLSDLSLMFDAANRKRLKEVGDKLPGKKREYKIYRGLSGEKKYRRPRSYSWTLSLDQACWFAARFDLENPAVYEATVKRSEILCYSNDRREQEIIVRPATCKKLPLKKGEIQQRAKDCISQKNG